MASFSIHLAIGKRYLEKHNNIKNIKEYKLGLIAPDLAPNKNETHYTTYLDKTNLEYYLDNRIQLYNYLKDNKVDNDYELGVFIHLITDYIFFAHFFDKEYIRSIDINIFNNDLYHSYDNIDNYVKTKYNIDYTGIKEQIDNTIALARKKKNTSYDKGKDILPKDKLDKFIEYVSDIDINKYIKDIIDNKKSILPY